MCLSRVTRLPSPESLLEEVEGWAVKANDGMSLNIHPLSLLDGFFRQRKPAWGLAHVTNVTYYDILRRDHDTYPSGFHVFVRKIDAEHWLRQRWQWCERLSGARTVRRVRGRGILAEGTQATAAGELPVVVVLELESLDTTAENVAA